MSGSEAGSGPYRRDFYRGREAAGEAASRVLPLVLDLVPARSVVDAGCGDGGWLAAFAARGLDDLLGLEGPWIEEQLLKIPPSRFRRVNLASPFTVERGFDLAISLEVAEHLPPASAAGFVHSLIRLAPVVLFSAAVPGQGGVHHVNEQWPAYWAALFAAHGYRSIDALRQRLWDVPGVPYWYKQNMLIYASEAGLAGNPRLAALAAASPPQPTALVHPELLAATARAAAPRIGRWLKMAPAALRRSLERRGRRAR